MNTLSPRHRDIYEALELDLKIATDGSPELSRLPPEELCRKLQHSRNKAHRPIYNAAAAVYCHQLYTRHILPEEKCPSLPEGKAAEMLRHSFGSTGNFFYLARTLATGTAVPGFLWLYAAGFSGVTTLGISRLPLYTLPDLRRFTPLFAIDLWEHAYMDEWKCDISGHTDSYLRRIDWMGIFAKLP